MTIRANCKINLGLFVTRKREDGYHELETVMLPVRELYDVVEVERMAVEGVQFEGSGIEVIDSGAAVARRVEWLLDRYDIAAAEDNLPQMRYITFADEEYRKRLEHKAQTIINMDK